MVCLCDDPTGACTTTAMAKEPGRRFQSAGQFREALEGTEVREGAWNPGSMWEGISGALQKLKPAPTQLASNDYRELIPAEPSSGSGPAPLPPALRELASSLSCLSGSGPSDSR